MNHVIISIEENDTAQTLKNKIDQVGLSYNDKDVESTFELLLEIPCDLKLQVDNNKVVSYIFRMKDIGQHTPNET